eukprot:718150-Prorocentrum_lima.AAC.1
MTSSLVGSEMCIRDSLNSFALPETFTCHSRSPCLTILVGVGVGEEKTAVSYTHLTLPTICSV